MLKKVRDIKADDSPSGEARHNGIVGIVEHPGVVTGGTGAPARKPRIDSLRVRRIKKFSEPRQPSRCWVERKGSAQRLIKIGLLSYAQAARIARAHQAAQPRLQEFLIVRSARQLQRIEPRRHAVPQWQVFAIKSAHQNLKAAVLVKYHLRRALPRKHCDQESDEHGLP